LRLALQVAVSTASAENGIVVVDEADTFLNSRFMFFTTKETVEKGWLNDFLDRTKVRIIWITNERDCIEPAVCRRFSYSLHFRDFSVRERAVLWERLARGHAFERFLDEALIRELAEGFTVNAGGIASALEAAPRVMKGRRRDRAAVKKVLEELLRKHEKLTFRVHARSWNTLSAQYDVEALNVSADVEAMVGAVRQFSEAAFEDEGNINLLFWGRPGTGKTEFARYVSAQCDRDLVVKRASDLLSCYVGQTEKRIAAAFEETAETKGILLIDEADSFFLDRKKAARYWEVTQTNELLTRMENHRGVLICCTNLLDTLDKAALRRFAWKVEFRPLTKDGKVKLYRKYFEESVGDTLSAAQVRRLAGIPELTPGDIKAVWLKYRYVPGGIADHGKIIEAIEQEALYSDGKPGQKIGFVG